MRLLGDILQARFQAGMLARVKVVVEDFGQPVEGAVQLGADILCRWTPDAQIEQHAEQKKGVNDRRRSRIEVIIGLGDELADLVDEQPDAKATQDRAEGIDSSVGQQQWQQSGHVEQEAAPEDMRDMQSSIAKLRIASQLEEEARE